MIPITFLILISLISFYARIKCDIMAAFMKSFDIRTREINHV